MRVSATSRTAVVRTRMPGGVGGAEPRGSPLSRSVALSRGSQGGEFTSAFGGVAEVHGRTASAAFNANDPSATLAVRCGQLPILTGPRRPTPKQTFRDVHHS